MKIRITKQFEVSKDGVFEFTSSPNYAFSISFEHSADILLEGTEKFAFKYQYFKGPQRIRLGPTTQFWSIYITKGSSLEWIKCLSNPLENEKVTARVLSESYLKALEAEGTIEPGTPLNPTKNTLSWIEAIDAGDVVVFEDAPSFKKFEFKGTVLKGLWIMDREPDTGIWVLAKSSGPK